MLNCVIHRGCLHAIIVGRGVYMQIVDLDENRVLEEAKKRFEKDYIELDHCDLYLESIDQGEIRVDGIDHPLFVSTHYVYEDHLVNNNKTRYKVPLTLIYRKKDPYTVLYDSYGKAYVAYDEDGIQFVLYEDFQSFLSSYVHIQ